MKSTSDSPGGNPQRTLLAVAAIVIVALLGLNVYLWINKNRQATENEQLSGQLDETEKMRAQLEKDYVQALSDLEAMKGSNAELNDLIDQKEAELTRQKKQIEGLLRNKGDLARARQQIAGLNTKIEQYLVEINQLRQQNEELKAENAQMDAKNQELSSNLESERQANQNLSSSQKQLQGEKQELERTRETLSRKVNAASVIKVDGIAVLGMDSKNKKTRRSKNTASLNICFNTTVNEIATPGNELFLIRVILPSGETMALDNLGSGVFVNNASGEQVRYTRSKETSYSNTIEKVCADWNPGQAFAGGQYKVEIYNKGYLAGSTSFSLN